MTTPPTTLKPYADAREVAGTGKNRYAVNALNPARTRVSVMTAKATAWNAQTLAMTGKVLATLPTRNATVQNMAKDARNLPKTLVMTGKVLVMVPTRNAPVLKEVRTALKRNQGNDIRPGLQGFPHIFKKHRTKKRCFLVKNILKKRKNDAKWAKIPEFLI